MPLRVKVCGISAVENASLALSLGTDFLGINRYQPSPRCVSKAKALDLLEFIPEGRRVLVDVCPSLDKLQEYLDEGFDYFQLHFDYAEAKALLPQWLRLLGREHLWLAPRLAKGEWFPEALFDYADTFLFDAYGVKGYGGSGILGDWPTFKALKEVHSDKTWILAGGLGPDSVERALLESGATFIDMNSGVESSPGVKDPSLLKAAFEIVRSFES